MKKILAILLFSIPLWAQTAHSDIKVDCAFCHACEQPTKTNPCLKDCPRHNMITVHQSPDEGPGIINIDEFKEKEDHYAPVKFSHRAHSEMSVMSGGCVMCHHYNPPGEVVSCKECHEINRQRIDLKKPDLKAAYHRQCLDCHRLWSSDNSCTSCHASNESVNKDVTRSEMKETKRIHPEVITPDVKTYETKSEKGNFVTFFHNDHTTIFGLECNDCHKNESCARCHMDNKILTNVKVSSEDKHEVCSNCHDTKNNCNTCHKDKVVEGFNHLAKTSFDLSKYHSKLTCKNCHKTPKKFKGLKGGCENCHSNWTSQNFNHKITGLELDEIHAENECTDCHTGVGYKKPTCVNCHDDFKYPENIPGKKL